MRHKTESLVYKRRRGVEDECAEDIDRGPDLIFSQSPAVGSLSCPGSLAHAISGSLPFRTLSTSAAAGSTPPSIIGSAACLAQSQGHPTTEDLR